MKKILLFVFYIAISCHISTVKAQGNADALMKQGQEFLTNKEYVKARSTFLHAFNAFVAKGKLWNAAPRWRRSTTARTTTRRLSTY